MSLESVGLSPEPPNRSLKQSGLCFGAGWWAAKSLGRGPGAYHEGKLFSFPHWTAAGGEVLIEARAERGGTWHPGQGCFPAAKGDVGAGAGDAAGEPGVALVADDTVS